jgi:hypothetical protein
LSAGGRWCEGHQRSGDPVGAPGVDFGSGKQVEEEGNGVLGLLVLRCQGHQRIGEPADKGGDIRIGEQVEEVVGGALGLLVIRC